MVSGAGSEGVCCREQANRIAVLRTITGNRARKGITGPNYLATAGMSLFAAQTNATIHPITLQPRNKFSRKIASVSRLLRASAMIDGRKYNTNGKPKNGKKKRWARTIATSLL
jgi:hypothetical protein